MKKEGPIHYIEKKKEHTSEEEPDTARRSYYVFTRVRDMEHFLAARLQERKTRPRAEEVEGMPVPDDLPDGPEAIAVPTSGRADAGLSWPAALGSTTNYSFGGRPVPDDLPEGPDSATGGNLWQSGCRTGMAQLWQG